MSYADAVLGDAPVGYWRLDELAGSSAVKDSAPATRHASSSLSGLTLGSPALYPGGPSSCKWNAASSKITVPFDLSTLGTAYSFECWFQWDGGVNKCVWGDSATFQLAYFRSTTPATFEWYSGNGSVTLISVVASLFTAGTDYHLVLAYDGTTASMFQNGDPIASAAHSSVAYSATTSLLLGADTSSVSGLSGGYGSEFAVYNKALNASQAKTHYQAGLRNGVAVG